MKFLNTVLFFMLWGFPHISSAAVWQTSNEWDQTWEDRYSAWVASDFNENFFTSGDYANISTDCADAVYNSRIVFAFQNQLPFRIKDPTGGSLPITQEMSRFDDVEEGLPRVRKFMGYIANLVSTKSLPQDSYPIAIKREYMRPGVIWSRPRITEKNFWNKIFGGTVRDDPGHAELIKKVSDTGVVHLIGSTVPRAVRPLISTTSLVFMPFESGTGFRAWKQPSYYGTPNEKLPGFSMEQYQIGTNSNGNRELNAWTSVIQKRLALRTENKEEALTRMAENICSLSYARLDAVNRALAYKDKYSGCMSKDAYDNYSTPSRDKRIRAAIDEFLIASKVQGATKVEKLKKMKTYFSSCQSLEIAEDKTLDILDFAIKAIEDTISSDPNDPYRARWGLSGKYQTGCKRY